MPGVAYPFGVNGPEYPQRPAVTWATIVADLAAALEARESELASVRRGEESPAVVRGWMEELFAERARIYRIEQEHREAERRAAHEITRLTDALREATEGGPCG